MKNKPVDLRGFRQNRSRRGAAVEIEVSSLLKPFGMPIAAIGSVLAAWQCGLVQDTSLTAGGFEINASPAMGDALIAELTEIATVLEAAKARTNVSCGIHVHVDARDFMYQDIQRLARLYAACEWALFASCTHWRVSERNKYCTPCGTLSQAFATEKEAKSAIITSLYGKEADKPYKHPGSVAHGHSIVDPPPVARYATNRRGNIGANRNRYWALNFHSWLMRGTVESRMRHGSVDATEMIMWARLWQVIVDFAYESSHSQMESLLSTTPAYSMPYKSVSHPAAMRAGTLALPTASVQRQHAVGNKQVLKGIGVLAHVLPKDVFEWFYSEVVKYDTYEGDAP